MNPDELVETWKDEEQKPFSGWDFSYLDDRMIEEQPPWSYSSRAIELLGQASSVIDLGTGGGERFLKLKDYWPRKTLATEDYLPNLELAQKRLSPFGAQVVEVKLDGDALMPFGSSEFDLILNRHSDFNTIEVARILALNGTFLTQQIHRLWAYDLLEVFGVEPQWPEATLENCVQRLRTTGLIISAAQEWTGELSFTDVGAVVYYLKVVPWLVPGFSVETHLKQLFTLQQRLEKSGSLVFVVRKYLVEAYKSPASRKPSSNSDFM